jgi:hypothetical protein
LDDLPGGAVDSPASVAELREVLDEEIARLPEKYRLVVSLCYCDGRTVAEAARLIGRPAGTVLSRLARARQRLQARLLSRGVSVAGGMLAAALSRPSTPLGLPVACAESVVSSAIHFAVAPQLAIESASSRAAALSEGVLRAMAVSKLQALVSISLLFGLLLGGASRLARLNAAAGTLEPPPTATAVESNILPDPQEPPAQPEPTRANSGPPAKMESAPGWQWVLTPRAKEATEWSRGGVVCLVAADRSGAQLVYVAYQGRFDPKSEDYRPVAFDSAGKRYLLTADRGGSSGPRGKGPVSMVCYRLDPNMLPHDKVAYVGVERNQGGTGK